MQCACVTLAEKLRGHLNLLCTFPGGHWIRVNIQCGHRKVGLPFLNKRPQRGRDGHCGDEVGTLGRDTENPITTLKKILWYKSPHQDPQTPVGLSGTTASLAQYTENNIENEIRSKLVYIVMLYCSVCELSIFYRSSSGNLQQV